MTEAQQQELDRMISALPFVDLMALQQRIGGWVTEKRNEAIARLEAEGTIIGVTIHDGNGVKRKGRRRHHEA